MIAITMLHVSLILAFGGAVFVFRVVALCLSVPFAAFYSLVSLSCCTGCAIP